LFLGVLVLAWIQNHLVSGSRNLAKLMGPVWFLMNQAKGENGVVCTSNSSPKCLVYMLNISLTLTHTFLGIIE
jgi:hypothetical protein